MNIEQVIQQVRDEIHLSNGELNVVAIVTDVLVDEGLDIRREPSLKEMKQILMEAFRAADERRLMTC